MSDYYTSREEFQVQKISEAGRFYDVPLASVSPVDLEVIRERAQAATILGDTAGDHALCCVYQSTITWKEPDSHKQLVQHMDLEAGDAILFVTQNGIYEAIVGKRPQKTTPQ